MEIDSKIELVKDRLEGSAPNTNGRQDKQKAVAEYINNDGELMAISKEYDIEIAANVSMDGTISDIRTSYSHSSVVNTVKGDQAVWHTHPSQPFRDNVAGEMTDDRSLSPNDRLLNRSWVFASYSDGSMVARQYGSNIRHLYQKGNWGLQERQF